MSQVEQGVYVWQKLISDVHCCLASINHRCPNIRFLRVGGKCIVISVLVVNMPFMIQFKS